MKVSLSLNLRSGEVCLRNAQKKTTFLATEGIQPLSFSVVMAPFLSPILKKINAIYFSK